MKRYFYGLLGRYVAYYLPERARIVEISPRHSLLAEALKPREILAVDADKPQSAAHAVTWSALRDVKPDRILLAGSLHFERDIQGTLERIFQSCARDTRVIVIYYNSLWKPVFRLAARLGLALTAPEHNWLSPSDVRNVLELSGFELTTESQRVLIPVYVPVLSNLVNRWFAALPLFRLFTIANVAVARPRTLPVFPEPPSVSVVVPARNERGTIEELVRRLPAMGPSDELIFVEGHSADGTWEEIQRVVALHPGRRIRCYRQSGSGKGDAVRLGFSEAVEQILMILDADLSVPPEALPRFYAAMVAGTAEFINGSRLVYPMERQAMRFANIIGNKFFAAAFSFLLGQPIKDTLCGTKALTREAYRTIEQERRYFGDFDPFGDFDLLFGASRLGLKIVELPVRYGERKYGATNIHRFAHGWLLLKMTVFAARRIKFI